jgi:hypothetical protein
MFILTASWLLTQTDRILYLAAACAGMHAPRSSAASGALGDHVVETLAISRQLIYILVLHTEQYTNLLSARILISGEYYYLLGCETVQSGSSSRRRNILSKPSRAKGKPSNRQEAPRVNSETCFLLVV